MRETIEDKRSIGDRVKEIRNSKNLTQQSFAKILNTSSGFISNIERAGKRPGSKFLSSLEKAFNVNLNWLFTGKGEMFTHELSPIKLDLMKNVIETVEKFSIERKLSLQPNKKAELIILLFEEVVEGKTKRQNLEERILRLMKIFSES